MSTVPHHDPLDGGPTVPPREPTLEPIYEPLSSGPTTGLADQYPDEDSTLSASDSASRAGDSTTDVAKQQASELKDTATDAAQQVAGTAKEQAGQVVAEARTQASSLLSDARGQLAEQAGTQQQRLASTVTALAKELGGMASKSEESGPLTDLAHQGSRQGGEIAHWLENHEPTDVLEQVKRFARRRPVAFLLICGAAGVVAGRLTRGAVAANTELDSPHARSGHSSPAVAPSSVPADGALAGPDLQPLAAGPDRLTATYEAETDR